MVNMLSNNKELENKIRNLDDLLAVNTIASQAANINDLIIKLSDFIAKKINNENISFYVLDADIFKSVHTRQNVRPEEYFEFESENEVLWAAMNAGELIKTTSEKYGAVFKSFWKDNDLEELDTQFLRAFFNGKTPICFCFIGKSKDGKEEPEANIEFLNKIFDYMEPVIVRLLDRQKKDNEVQELQKSLYNVSILYNISQAVNFIDDLKRLLQVVLSKALTTLEAEKGSLMLYDYSENSLQVKVVYGLADKKTEDNINSGLIECAKIKAGEGVAGTVFLDKKAIITNLGSADPRFAQKNTLTNTQSLLCVPLIAKGEAIGVINISNKKFGKLFNQRDLEFMSSLANQAAIAIDNAKLYELATKDGLTKLYIYRHFYTLLENEIRRCARYKHNMSILMIDIDDFKPINDTFGHLVGDQILREISNEIAQTVRKIDVPARYGGEEFAVILPETSKEEAVIIAERLRKNISKIRVLAGENKEVTATASFGISQYPQDGLDAKTLIGSADSALYYSKKEGKNSVSIFYKDGSQIVPKSEEKQETT